jgi:hypothetical protein
MPSIRPSIGAVAKKSPIAAAPGIATPSGGIVSRASSASRATSPPMSTASRATSPPMSTTSHASWKRRITAASVRASAGASR